MLTALILVAVAAFILTLIAAAGKVPLWVPLLLACIFELLTVIPLGK